MVKLFQSDLGLLYNPQFTVILRVDSPLTAVYNCNWLINADEYSWERKRVDCIMTEEAPGGLFGRTA